MESSIKYLSWDSEFFGLKIGRVDVFSIQELDQLRTRGYDLVYVFAKKQFDVANSSNILLIDKKVVFNKKISGIWNENNNNIVSVNRANNSIVDLALLSGNFSRFKLDNRLSHKFKEMYKTWLQRSLKREIASEVLVYENEGVALGFVTINRNSSIATIGLIAVNEMHQGKKIGSALMRAVENWCIKCNVFEIDVTTQLDNKQACYFYERNGYSIKQIDYIYHYYIN